METNQAKMALTFGEFVVTAYNAWGKRRAKGIVWLAVNARLVKFPGQRRFVIFELSPK